MWRNVETREFVDWLYDHNAGRTPERRTAFYGLDLYSLFTSIAAVLAFLDRTDPALARTARERYGCLSPWEADMSSYGRASLPGHYHKCEEAVAHILVELLQKRQRSAQDDPDTLFDATQNARLIADAEAYYRTMYYGSRAAWNIRDTHMFETLRQALNHHGPAAKAVVWAHNSHIGDASATEMGRRGEHNLGQLARVHFGDGYYAIGMGTDRGTVAAADEWDGPMRSMRVRPSHVQSYERLFHLTRAPGLILPLRAAPPDLRGALAEPRLQRAIGVVYRPDSELASHYFETNLVRQFDDYIWIDRTHAVTPLAGNASLGVPDTYPFGI
jgi:protein-L-isoaspartate(D-aspartate) O-methyltransferase